MPRINCKACGASINTAFYICPHCGVKRADRELLKDVNIAYNADDSAAARRFYANIVANEPLNAEAYWGLFLLDCGVKDEIESDGIMQRRITAENFLFRKMTAKLYDGIISNENYIQAVSLAEGDFERRVNAFRRGLEERGGNLPRETENGNLNKFKDTEGNVFNPSSGNANGRISEDASDGGNVFDEIRLSEKSSKKAYAPKTAPKISAGNWVASIFCCLPVILELLVVLLIPKIGVLAENTYVARWGWQALSLPMKISFISVIVLGFAIQVLGLLNKLHKVLGMFTQIISFGLFVLSAYALYDNASSVYIQWGLALIVPVSLLVTALRYVSADGFGFIDDFNFWYYLPIVLEVAEYVLFFLIFRAMFGVSASLWFFVAITVTTVASIAVSSFWEDFHWAPVAINLGVAVLLCVIAWLGRLFASEWFLNGGVITVVILAIGGSWFIHWFIHRNDP